MELPQIDIVTCFVVRRQRRRRLGSTALELMLRKFPRLEQLIYEPWRVDSNAEQVTDFGYMILVQFQLPKTLKRVCVFEDCNEELLESLVDPLLPGNAQQASTTRMVDPGLGAAFAYRSIDLEYLSVSYMIDAEDFFRVTYMQTSSPWQRLETLALTTQLLHYDIGHGRNSPEIDILLRNAGFTALQMPKLQTLVLWNGVRGNACAFIYHADRGGTQLTWRGTWDLDLRPSVVKVWQDVAMKFRSSELLIDHQHIDDVIRNHGDAVHCLNLPCQVVAPASLWQIRKEGAYAKV